ncbi:MAG: NAD(P)-binding domain-containing protein [Acidobacteriota bacterium]|nr:NAD(P)-binding domain-containing protein [Acidobacteriota bacterium]
MKILVLGAGNVGGALARLWRGAGHDVDVVNRRQQYGAGTTEEIAAAAEVVALCVPWAAAEEALGSCGKLSGKVVIDCTNPLTAAHGPLCLEGGTSAAERLQALYPAARVVKAFNSLGAHLLGNAGFGTQKADGSLCGDNASAKSAVVDLVRAAGLCPVDVGPLRNARYLEAMAMLWIDLAIHQRRTSAFAFKLLTRTEGAAA